MRTKSMRKTTAQKRNSEHTNANTHFMPASIPTQMQTTFCMFESISCGCYSTEYATKYSANIVIHIADSTNPISGCLFIFHNPNNRFIIKIGTE